MRTWKSAVCKSERHRPYGGRRGQIVAQMPLASGWALPLRLPRSGGWRRPKPPLLYPREVPSRTPNRAPMNKRGARVFLRCVLRGARVFLRKHVPKKGRGRTCVCGGAVRGSAESGGRGRRAVRWGTWRGPCAPTLSPPPSPERGALLCSGRCRLLFSMDSSGPLSVRRGQRTLASSPSFVPPPRVRSELLNSSVNFDKRILQKGLRVFIFCLSLACRSAATLGGFSPGFPALGLEQARPGLGSLSLGGLAASREERGPRLTQEGFTKQHLTMPVY